MILAILIINVVMLLMILAIHSTIGSLVIRIAELEIDVEETKEKLDKVFPDRVITENDV